MKKYIIAHNYMCLLALIEMIIIDTCSYSPISQIEMSELFGLTLPPNTDSPLCSNYSISHNTCEYGVHVSAQILNQMFMHYNLPILATYSKESPYEYNTIDEYPYISPPNRYLIYTFGYGYLFNENDKLNLGHAALLESVVSKSHIKIYDPGPANAGIKIVNRVDMHEAMIKRSGGIFIFTSLT